MNERFQFSVERSLSLEHLAVFRIFFASFLFFFSGFPRFDWISSYPDFFYNPNPSFASFFEQFPNRSVFIVINFLLPLLTLFLLVGFKTRISSITLGIILIINSSFLFAFGKITHSHLIYFTPVIFSFSGWGDRYSIDSITSKKNNKRVNVIPIFALIIAFSYFTSAMSKIFGGWLDFDYQAAYNHLILNYHFSKRTALLSTVFLNIHSAVFWEVIDYLVIIIEALPLCVLFNRKGFSAALYCLALFHVLVYLLFNISFAFYPILFSVFLINWEQSLIVKRILRLIDKNRHRFSKLFILIFMVILYFFYVLMMYLDMKIFGEYPLGYIISLFLSFILVSIFYCENIMLKYGSKHCSKG